MTLKILTWALRQRYGKAKGDKILAALENNTTFMAIIAMVDTTAVNAVKNIK